MPAVDQRRVGVAGVNKFQGRDWPRAIRKSRDTAVVTVPGPLTPAESRSQVCERAAIVTARRITAIEESQIGLVLSLFPGIDLLGRGFEDEGACVVRGPDVLWGGDIRSFSPPRGVFRGIIAGSPCQDFSRARRSPPTGEGMELLGEFVRCVVTAWPEWFLLENVPTVPAVVIDGYQVQRFDLRACEVGLKQSRLRHFQFGSRDGKILVLDRDSTALGWRQLSHGLQRCCMASEGGRKGRRSFADFCQLQGLPRNFSIEPLCKGWRYRVVGNGVPVPMARLVARAVKGMRAAGEVTVCRCGCGRPVTGKAVSSGPACRKRLERARRDAAGGVNL